MYFVIVIGAIFFYYLFIIIFGIGFLFSQVFCRLKDNSTIEGITQLSPALILAVQVGVKNVCSLRRMFLSVILGHWNQRNWAVSGRTLHCWRHQVARLPQYILL